MKGNQVLLSTSPPARWGHHQTSRQPALRIQLKGVWEYTVLPQSPCSSHRSSSNATRCTKPTIAHFLLQHHPRRRQQPLAWEKARSASVTQPCLCSETLGECLVVCIRMVPEDHLACSQTAVVQHLGGVRQWGW